MKFVAASATALSIIATAGALRAEPGTASHRVFACALGAKSVSVTASGNQLVYSFGTAAHTELRVVASASRKNVFFRTDRYAGPQQQLRFVNGAYSYIVYSMAGNAETEAQSVSGLVVTKDGKKVADMPCSTYSELGGGFDYE
ncbi:MAG: hypothetical protein EON55_21900, partial [Alphaproteobacteria bacterium]